MQVSSNYICWRHNGNKAHMTTFDSGVKETIYERLLTLQLAASWNTYKMYLLNGFPSYEIDLRTHDSNKQVNDEYWNKKPKITIEQKNQIT